MKPINIMKPIDKFIIGQLSNLVETSEYQKFLDLFNSWEDKFQNLFKAGLIFLTLFIPFMFAFMFSMFHSSAVNDLEIKEQIISTASSIISRSNDVEKSSRKYFGRKPLISKSDFERELKNALPQKGIDTSKISIGQFNSEEVNGVNESSAQLKFKELSNFNLFGFLNVLSIRSKMKIDEINIKKNASTNLLEGTAKVFHYSKVEVEEQ
jgi:hypothetical protein